jgi:Flp pilus assembly protein CpaB
MTSTAMPQPAPRLRRIDLRVVLGLALLLAGVLRTVAMVQRAGERVPVLVMARDVPAGQVLGDQDVRVADLGLTPGVATLGVADRARVVGRVASALLGAGQVLSPAAVTDGPALGPGQVAMSLAVAPEHAAAGMLRAGDQVAVIASGKPDQPDARAEVVLSPVPVLSVLTPEQEGGGEDRLLVSLAVALDQAPLLARAAQGSLHLVLLARGGGG